MIRLVPVPGGPTRDGWRWLDVDAHVDVTLPTVGAYRLRWRLVRVTVCPSGWSAWAVRVAPSGRLLAGPRALSAVEACLLRQRAPGVAREIEAALAALSAPVAA